MHTYLTRGLFFPHLVAQLALPLWADGPHSKYDPILSQGLTPPHFGMWNTKSETLNFNQVWRLTDRQHRILRGEQEFLLLNTSLLWAPRVQRAFSNDSHYTNCSSLVIFVAICFVMLLRVLQSMNNPCFPLLTLGFESRLWAVCGMLEHELFIPGALDDTIPCLAYLVHFRCTRALHSWCSA